MNNEEEFSLSNIKYTINYIITHYEKFLLLLLVCVIIYFVDYITYINGIIYGGVPQAIPGLSNNKIPFSKRKKSV